jgi:two-component system, OmpR family, sensor histidine kinase ChvG
VLKKVDDTFGNTVPPPDNPVVVQSVAPRSNIFRKSTRLLRRAGTRLSGLVFSSLLRRILILNLAALVVLLTGILYMNQFREGLIDARVESLMTQGEIIAGAISASASVDTDALRIDPEKLFELQAGQSISPSIDTLDSAEFLINPERVAPVLRRLISPTRTRARIYDRDGELLLDTRHLYSGGQVLRYELEPLDGDQPGLFERGWAAIAAFFDRTNLPTHIEKPGENASAYSEVVGALEGQTGTVVRMSSDNEIIVSVAVPVQRYRAVLGVLQLSTQGADIDKIIFAERMAVLRVFTVASIVTMLLSLLLASTIATPLKKLSAAAARVRRGVTDRQQIPDFSARRDEVGDLSVALGAMTDSLYARIDAIERFAADVAHELKNPLTSLRSAVETLPLVKNDESRKRLLDVIQHDVRRLDRLISDISDASRLDAELGRDDLHAIDLAELLREHVDAVKAAPGRGTQFQLSLAIEGFAKARPAKETASKTKATLSKTNSAKTVLSETTAETNAADAVATDQNAANKAAKATPEFEPVLINGHDLRLGQVIHNLIDNARSFIPQTGGTIRILLANKAGDAEITIEDNGSGIAEDAFEKIFQRFYTDRPGIEAFGQNSGLGLSISRQIIEAHGGTLTAQNAINSAQQITGARFIITLPLLGAVAGPRGRSR